MLTESPQRFDKTKFLSPKDRIGQVLARGSLIVGSLFPGLVISPSITHADPVNPTVPGCEFVLGFKSLHDLIPPIVSDCTDNEQHNPQNGDGLQHTNKGLLVWRKIDNWTAFTDGYRTWINGPYGLQERLNSERFQWEPAAANPGATEELDDHGQPIQALTPIPALTTPEPTAIPELTPVPNGPPLGGLALPAGMGHAEPSRMTNLRQIANSTGIWYRKYNPTIEGINATEAQGKVQNYDIEGGNLVIYINDNPSNAQSVDRIVIDPNPSQGVAFDQLLSGRGLAEYFRNHDPNQLIQAMNYYVGKGFSLGIFYMLPGAVPPPTDRPIAHLYFTS